MSQNSREGTCAEVQLYWKRDSGAIVILQNFKEHLLREQATASALVVNKNKTGVEGCIQEYMFSRKIYKS